MLRSLLSMLGFKPTKPDTEAEKDGQNDIPSPKARLPGIGHVAEFMRVFGAQAHEWLTRRHSEFGPVYTFSALGRKMVYLFSLEDFLTVKKTEGRYPEHFDFKHLRLYRRKNDLPMGLLVSRGSDWSKQRRSVDGSLTRTSQLTKYTLGLIQIVDSTIEELCRMGTPVCVMDEVASTYVIKAMSRIILGFSSDEDESAWRNIRQIADISRENFKDAKILLSLPTCLWGLLPAWWRHSARWDRLLSITKRYIEKCLTGSLDCACVLGHLLQLQTLTLAEVHMNITDLILASVDTTSSTLLWVLHELSVNPEVQTRLRSELQDIDDYGDQVSYSNFQQCLYLRAVIKETLRLHPVGFFASRVTQSNTTVHGYTIEAGVELACSMYTAGRDADRFDTPEVFQPERWMTRTADLDTFFGNVPFGFGKRMCVGRKVAELVIMMFIFKFCTRFEFQTNDEVQIKPTFRILMVPDQPLTLRLQATSP